MHHRYALRTAAHPAIAAPVPIGGWLDHSREQPVSGPKVVRIVTREEIVALCESHLQRLAKAAARWQVQAERLGVLDTAEVAATRARHARLQTLLTADRFTELQKAVPLEIEFLQRDVREREAQAIERATQHHQRTRQVQDNANALIKALNASGQPQDAQVLQALEQLANAGNQQDADRVLARGVATLTQAVAAPGLSEAQQALAQQLKGDAQPLAYAEWLARHSAPASRDERLLRIDRHLAELQLLQGTPRAAAFVTALQRAEAEERPAQRNLLLDSLMIELASATRTFQQVRERLAHLEDLASELHAVLAEREAALLTRIAACTPADALIQLDDLIAQTQAVLDAHAQTLAAQARRDAVLQGLASLGYEVREGMATGWAETGRVVLRKPAIPGYGVEVGGRADNARLQVRAVAFDPERDKGRDRDIETLWCGDFQRLQALLGEQGNALLIEQARAVGEVPLKEVEQTTERDAGRAALKRHE